MESLNCRYLGVAEYSSMWIKLGGIMLGRNVGFGVNG